MKNFILFSAVLVSLAACGDNNKATDAAPSRDAPNPDALVIPTPPTLGAEIDRMGRPGINTALNHTFDNASGAAAVGSDKDMYNQDKSGIASWGSNATYIGASTGGFVQSLAILDALDQGLGTAGGNGSACGNQVLYDGTGSGTAHACFSGATYQTTCSYNTATSFSLDDELYLETSRGTCNLYLAVELYTGGVLSSGGVAPSCGGRAPSYDVIDVTYSALAAFPAAFNTTTLAPLIGDGVGMHADTSDATFPFLGTPH